MILVDTSVWIDHFREGVSPLALHLDAGRVLMHPFVLGELACGNLQSRAETLRLLANLPPAARASDPEIQTFIEAQQLMGRGIGLIDVHLLASAALGADVRLWTRDKRLAQQAERLHLAHSEEFEPPH